MNERTRRRVLRSAATLGVAAVAGCSSRGTDDRGGPPGHEAVLETASYEAGPPSDAGESANVEAGTLSVTIDAADTTDEKEGPGDGCVQCLGAVTYRADVKLENASGLETITVDHATPTGADHRIQPGQDPDDGSHAVVGTSIETVDSGCGTGEDGEVEVAFEGASVVVEGSLPAPTPCHEAVLADVEVEGDELSLRVDVRSTGEVCVECVGAIEYEAVVELDDAITIESVRIDHVTRGGDESVVAR
jgi:hypothetical protein